MSHIFFFEYFLVLSTHKFTFCCFMQSHLFLDNNQHSSQQNTVLGDKLPGHQQ